VGNQKKKDLKGRLGGGEKGDRSGKGALISEERLICFRKKTDGIMRGSRVKKKGKGKGLVSIRKEGAIRFSFLQKQLFPQVKDRDGWSKKGRYRNPKKKEGIETNSWKATIPPDRRTTVFRGNTEEEGGGIHLLTS